jgi:hypothetical protein
MEEERRSHSVYPLQADKERDMKGSLLFDLTI